MYAGQKSFSVSSQFPSKSSFTLELNGNKALKISKASLTASSLGRLKHSSMILMPTIAFSDTTLHSPTAQISPSYQVPLDSWCYTSRVKTINIWTYDLLIGMLQVEHLLSGFYWMAHTRVLVFWNNLQGKCNFAAVGCISKDRGGSGWLVETCLLLQQWNETKITSAVTSIIALMRYIQL